MQDGIETAHGAEVSSVANRLVTAGIPSGFCVLPGGIYEQSAEENSEPAWLCSPIAVVARFRDALGKGWGRILEIEDPEGRRQRISLFDKDVEARPSAIRADLVNLGLRTQNGSKPREALTRLLREWQPTKIMTSTYRLGWADGSCAAFVRADGLLVPADGNNLARRAPRWAERRPRVYVVRRRLLEDSIPTIAVPTV